ncbi:MAG TPA: cellulose binding domain-containing protein [Mycobacteriales bacterium]|nr:cellulose binding domain-containing protein [Mycobacteriales bacterium]
MRLTIPPRRATQPGRATQPRRTAAGAAVLLAAAALVTTSGPAAQAAAGVQVTVNARAALATVPATGLGINDAVWDPALGSTATSDLLGAAGVQMMRYPGGSYGDIYHWRDNTAPGGSVAPNTDFDTFMGSVRRVGAQPIIIANYGTGSPAEAADWVRYANVTKGYGARYWEIGNEIYGNGHYGANWEADNHADKSPTAYANAVVEYAAAMKAVDPSVKIGAVLTTPANWPDAVLGGGDQANWNQTVLSIAGSKIDFVVLHWYPPQSSAADVLTKPGLLPDTIYLIRQQLARYAGPNAARLGIAVTETSSSVAPNTQPGALFLADAYSGLLENGVFTVDWWNVHNGAGTVSTVEGQTDYGDWGMLSSATCSAGGCEPALNTPFAPYYALSMMSTFARPGDQFVRASSNQPLVSAHAVRRGNGDLAVLLVNKDPASTRQVTLDYAGFTPAATAPKVYSFSTGATSISSGAAGTATSQTLPPYSLTTVLLHPGAPAGALPATPGQPAASAVTDRSATLSWPAVPGLSYAVYRQTGAGSELLAQTPGGSATVRGLSPGTRYVFNVVAADPAGAESWASAPLEVTTGTPPKSSCAVHLTDVNDWGSGFVGSIDITNKGTAPVDGWTLTFTWGSSLQQLAGGWNGTWAQSGNTVTVTNADFNTTLAAGGGTANVGFVGNYGGPNVLPLVFSLNGTICTATG